MNVLIVDDEKRAIDLLKKNLEKYDDIDVVASAMTGAAGLQKLIGSYIDVVFLDIKLPDINGMEFMARMREKHPKCKVVICSGFDEYMLQAFRESAFDFLLKPIDDSELDIVIKRLRKEEESPKESSIRKQGIDRILVYTNAVDFHIVNVSDIVVFQYNGNIRSWEVVIAGFDRPVRLKRTINKELLLHMDSQFVQVNQRYIINFNYLMSVPDNTCRFYPPFSHIDYVTVSHLFRKRLIQRFNTL